MVTIAELAEQLGVSKPTVRNHISRLGLWDGVQRGDGGTISVPNAVASAVAASVSKTAVAGTGRPQGLANRTQEGRSKPEVRACDSSDLVEVWRARFDDERARADRAEAAAGRDRAGMVEAMAKVAELSASEADARARAEVAEAEAARLRAELDVARADVAAMLATVEAVRNASPLRRLCGLGRLLPPPAGGLR